ncbi:MAG: hypothetical protein AB8H03_18255 [Saprospiraceae bacterium]
MLKKTFFIFLLFSIGVIQLKAQRVIEFKSKYGHKLLAVFDDENPENISDWNLSFRMFNVNIVQNKTDSEDTQVEGLLGPVALDFDFQKMFFNHKTWTNLRLVSMPDTRYSDNLSDDFKKRYLSAEFVVRQELFSYTFNKKKKINFLSSNSRIGANGKMIRTVFKVKPDVKQKRSFGIRGGVKILQHSYLVRANKYSKIGYDRIYSTDKFMLNIGLSVSKVINLQYSTYDNERDMELGVVSKYGEQKAFLISGSYVDLLYAPSINLYGANDIMSGKIDENILDIKRVGIRFGGYAKVSKMRVNMGSIYFYEIGWFPSALKDFQVTFGYGWVFGKFKIRKKAIDD